MIILLATRMIEHLESEKGEINDDLLRSIRSNRTYPISNAAGRRLHDEIEEIREELEAKATEIKQSSTSVHETRDEKAQFEEQLDELRSTRSELEHVRYEIESTNDSITSLKQERNEIKAELGDLPDAPMGEHTHLDDQIGPLREQKQRLERYSESPERDPVQ